MGGSVELESLGHRGIEPSEQDVEEQRQPDQGAEIPARGQSDPFAHRYTPEASTAPIRITVFNLFTQPHQP